MREQEFMKEWVEDHLRQHPKDYWLRIPDTGDGIKPFDGVLVCKGTPVAIEFKVWRKVMRFDYSSVKAHQLRELLAWEKAKGRSRIVVLHQKTGKVELFVPKQALLRKLLEK